MQDLNLTRGLSELDRALALQQLASVTPDENKYTTETDAVRPFLSATAEWKACASFQRILLRTRATFGKAEQRHVHEVTRALKKIDPLNMSLLEKKVTKHDQLAVVEEIGRHVSPETKALLHPGTTSYDPLDTIRAYLLRRCWDKVFRPKVQEVVSKLCTIAEQTLDILQTGRTHLQNTSPVLFGGYVASYAARLADRSSTVDRAIRNLKGKVSGIVGTGASIDAVIGEGTSLQFEEAVLKKLGLEADLTASQVTAKERFADLGHAVVSLMTVLGNFADDMRILYSAAINEITSRASATRLGGSSADAAKDNPIHWENIAGKVAVVESGMRVLYEMMHTNLQRDLRSSVQARYQPGGMIAETYESFHRASKALDELSLNRDKIAQNLEAVRRFPSEAMVAIMRSHGWIHSDHGVGHDAVKVFSQKAKASGQPLLEVAIQDPDFSSFYAKLSDRERRILNGELELYTGSARERATRNIAYARMTA